MIKVLDFVSNFVHSDERMSQKKEVRKMKKFLGLLLVLGMMAGVAYANNPDTCLLTVTPSVSYSISIASATAGSAADFGTMALSATKDIYVGTVTNNGTITMGIKKKGAISGGWSLTSAIGTDKAILQIGFCTNTSTAATTGATLGYATNVSSVGEGAQSVTDVNYVSASASSGMSAKLSMPNGTTVSGAHTMTLSLYADTTW
ncbi:MAG: hypothetical protein HY919_03120 [Elusimicrobia bacterium]|nr:hypothetical protein [Elusimicrobiota bacterium]